MEWGWSVINEPCVKPEDEMRLVLETDFYRPTVLIPSPGATLGPVLQILCFADSHGLFPRIRPFLWDELFTRFLKQRPRARSLRSIEGFSLPFNLIIIARTSELLTKDSRLARAKSRFSIESATCSSKIG